MQLFGEGYFYILELVIVSENRQNWILLGKTFRHKEKSIFFCRSSPIQSHGGLLQPVPAVTRQMVGYTSKPVFICVPYELQVGCKTWVCYNISLRLYGTYTTFLPHAYLVYLYLLLAPHIWPTQASHLGSIILTCHLFTFIYFNPKPTLDPSNQFLLQTGPHIHAGWAFDGPQL